MEEEEERGGELQRKGGNRERERGTFIKSMSRKQNRERERGEQTVKARAGSPELSVGSLVSGYHAV